MCSLLTFTLPCPEKMAQGKAHFWLNVSFNWICNAVVLLIISCCAIHVEMPNLTDMNLWISDPCDTMLEFGGRLLEQSSEQHRYSAPRSMFTFHNPNSSWTNNCMNWINTLHNWNSVCWQDKRRDMRYAAGNRRWHLFCQQTYPRYLKWQFTVKVVASNSFCFYFLS